MSDGVVKVNGCQPYGSLATEGFNQPCNKGGKKKKKKRCSDSHPNVSDKCEVRALQRLDCCGGGEGGLTGNERVED